MQIQIIYVYQVFGLFGALSVQLRLSIIRQSQVEHHACPSKCFRITNLDIIQISTRQVFASLMITIDEKESKLNIKRREM